MLKSMTGYGRYENDTEKYKITAEIKSVNHRYFELSVKMPKKLNFFEAGIRSILKQHISRGKIDLFVTYEDYQEGRSCIKYNAELAGEYFDKILEISRSFSLPGEVTAFELAKLPDVLLLEEQSIDEQELWEILQNAVQEACLKFVASRIEEGGKLKEDIQKKLCYLNEMVEEIEMVSPKLVQEYKEKLTNKVNELLGGSQIEESRILTETAIFADKICVDEETVRLKAHVSNMQETLKEGDNIGRKLDFIAQEMNREANTVLSKINDMSVTDKAINIKTEIEKIREQIQNIE